MTSTVEQAWALPVDIARLGAHLEAYAETTLRSTIDTLRLCNRFGQGDEGITTLPNELVEHVEQYLMEDERADQRQLWEWEQACGEGRCEPIEHADDDVVHETYHDMQDSGDLEHTAEDRLCVAREYHRLQSAYRIRCPAACRLCEILGPSEPHSAEHVGDQRVKVKERLKQLESDGKSSEFDRYCRHWDDVCYEQRASWTNRVSERGSSSRDPRPLGQLAKVFHEDFGLQIRIAHGPWTIAQQGLEEFLQRPATAYLQLPVQPPTQDSGNAPIPPDAKLARFARAVRILGLDSVPGAEAMDRSVLDGKSKTSRSVEDVGAVGPRLVTFCKFADDDYGRLMWVFNCPMSNTLDGERELPGEGDWMWAVVDD
ncbi:unnamed protein product [Zymoseptoria tritici ST99CH_1A5]|uniref:Uncharacterized protein n=1 Tax=Zymoseptoria tritici ST99CH_1A5 TaxID=1276529 RepID=A0A1Y6L4B7_ZYMTR|nr:unnamed protein product [Zymoseptoria tritici ST99CH_1A5]